jgi:hypothetical protein
MRPTAAGAGLTRRCPRDCPKACLEGPTALGPRLPRQPVVRPLTGAFLPFDQRTLSAEAVRKRDFQGPMRERQEARQVSQRFRFSSGEGLRRPSSPG